MMVTMLLTVWWVPQQLLQKAVFDTFSFEGGGDQKSSTRTDPKYSLFSDSILDSKYLVLAMPRQLEDDKTLHPRNSLLVSKTRRDSVPGRVSRRNSHCSIIEMSDHVVLVEMMTDQPTAANHRQISHHDSLDLLTNIRQMEETQKMIQNTMSRIRYPEKPLVPDSSCESQNHASSDVAQGSDCDNHVPSETIVTNKIRELLKSVLRVGNKKPEEKKHLSKNIDYKVHRPMSMSKGVHKTVNESCSEVMFREKRQKKQNMKLHIVKELVTSEQNYVDNLELLCKDFRHFMILQTNPVQSTILEFNNLFEIFNLSKDMLQEFDNRISIWNFSNTISDIFVKNGERMSVYTSYLQNFTTMISQFDQHCRKYPEFGNLVTIFEKSPKCRKLKIEHFLLKPVQRLPQYKLIFEEYLKQSEEDDEDYKNTEEALKIVTDVLKHANDSI